MSVPATKRTGAKQDRRKIILVSILTMVLVSSAVLLSLVYSLYQAAIQEKRTELNHLVNRWGALIESDSFGDTLNLLSDSMAGDVSPTLQRIKLTHEHLGAIAETGELVLARRNGEVIEFLLGLRHQNRATSIYQLPISSDRAIAMRLALNGESGTSVSNDYRGVHVVAAYRPLRQLGMGLVAKIDLTELQQPFIRASMLAIGISWVFILLGTLGMWWKLNPIVRRLEGREELERAYRHLRAEIKQRKQAEIILGQLNSALEKRVTSRTRSLSQSEARFRALAANAPVGIFLTDPKGRCLYTNDRWSRHTGISNEAAKGRNWLESLHPDDLPHISQAWANSLETGQEFTADFRFLTRENQVTDLTCKAIATKDPHGHFVGFIGTILDITEHKKSAVRNLQQRQQLDALNEILQIGTKNLPLESKLSQCIDILLALSWLKLTNKGGVFLTQGSKDTLYLAASRNLSRENVTRCQQIAFGDHLDERHVIGYPDITEHGHYNVPIVAGDRLLGVIVLYLEAGHERTDREAVFLTSAAGALAGFVERDQAIIALKDSEERFELAVRGTSDGLWDWNPVTNEVWLAPRWKELLGFRDDELENSFDTWETRLHPDDLNRTMGAIRQHLEHDAPFDVEYRLKTKNNEYRWFRARGEAIRNKAGKAIRVAGSIQDITKQKNAESQLLHDAMHDALTTLPNRALFLDRLNHAMVVNKRLESFTCAVFFLDLDRFKIINDSLGHLSGDLLLKQVAERLRSCLRSGDTIARFGGDEFVILLNQVRDGREVKDVLSRIQEELSKPIPIEQHEVHVTGSIGVAYLNSSYNEGEEILRDADTAMFHAKNNGGGRYEIFTPALRKGAVNRFSLEKDLRKALYNHELELHYQPIIQISDNTIVGFEALARWNHPAKGYISPTEFIPVAEEIGLIIPLGKWVVETACREIHALHSATNPHSDQPYVSVNLSPRQLAQRNLVPDMESILKTTQLNPRYLRLEITETLIMENTGTAAKVLPQLKQLDLTLCMDDFGTGYSALSYLHSFPLDVIKIDRAFINNMTQGDRKAVLVDSIITLAKKLKMEVIAEGVETDEQQKILAALGCTYIQGFVFSKPLPADQIQSFYLSHTNALAEAT